MNLLHVDGNWVVLIKSLGRSSSRTSAVGGASHEGEIDDDEAETFNCPLGFGLFTGIVTDGFDKGLVSLFSAKLKLINLLYLDI